MKAIKIKDEVYTQWEAVADAWGIHLSHLVVVAVQMWMKENAQGTVMPPQAAPAAAPQAKPEQKETAKQKEEKRMRYTCGDSFTAAIRDEYDNYPDDELDMLYQDAHDWRRTGEADGYAYGLEQKGFTAQEFITFHDLRTISKEKGIW